MPKAISTWEYSVVREIKSSALAVLGLKKESPMKLCFLEIVILDKSFWSKLYGCFQGFNYDIMDLGRKPRLAFLVVANVGPAVPDQEKRVLEPERWF